MVGAFIAVYLLMSLQWNYWAVLVVTGLAMAIIGIVIERTVFRRLINAPHVSLFVAALGLLTLLQGIVVLINGGRTLPILGPYKGSILELGAITIPVERLIIIIATAIILVLLQLFMSRTKIGTAIEATSQDKEGSALVGINVNLIYMTTSAISVGLAGVAAVLIGPITQFSPGMGMAPLLAAFAAVIFGGLGSLGGAVLGAFVIGMVEVLSVQYIGSEYVPILVFGTMIIILIVRPKGILGTGR
jgi:branched-chain amino acid transport system permease protein